MGSIKKQYSSALEENMTGPSKRLLRVFLCHASADKSAVRSLYESLITNEIDVWLDEENLIPGQNWQQEIPKAVKNSDVVVLCLSKNSINKEGYIQKEIKFALDIANEKTNEAIYIIPAKLEECEVPDKFSVYQWVNLFKKKGYERLLRALSLRAEQINAITPRKNAGLFSLPRSIDETVGKFSFQFREEVVKQIFEYIKDGESFYVIGTPNVGQSHLIDFINGDIGSETDRDYVKKKYLGEKIANNLWLARVDMNRMSSKYDWDFLFYELLFHTLILSCNRLVSTEQIEKLKVDLSALAAHVIQGKDALMAHRLFEMAINMLCQSYGFTLCFVFENFDETYQTIPREIMGQLRAIRDANKHRISYGLFLRNLPEVLRDPIEIESFYELIASNMLGVGPYSRRDTFYIIEQLENRQEYKLSSDIHEWLYEKSGGHPGLIQALFIVLKEAEINGELRSNVDWFVTKPLVQDELRKIWASLSEDEKNGLLEIATGARNNSVPITSKLLLAKGLLRFNNNTAEVFSPLLNTYLTNHVKSNSPT